jgi:hypothetical protein
MHPVPLAVVATELNCGVRQLEERHGEFVIRDDAGIRCLPSDMVRNLVSHRDEQVAEQRAEARAKQPQPNLARERVQAIAQRQRSNNLEGLSEFPLGVQALATMAGADKLDRLDEAATRADEFMSGESIYHPVKRERD